MPAMQKEQKPPVQFGAVDQEMDAESFRDVTPQLNFTKRHRTKNNVEWLSLD